MGDFPDGAVVKNPPASAGDTGLIPDLGRSHMHAATKSSHATTKTQRSQINK